MTDFNTKAPGLIKAWQTHLHIDKTPELDFKETSKQVVEAPRQYNVLLVGFSGIGYAFTIHEVLKGRHQNIEFTAADDANQAKELLVQAYHANQIYDLVVISDAIKPSGYIGVVTDQLRQRSMCGEVFVFSPVDELQARKLSMTPVNNIEQLVYNLRPKEVKHNLGRATPKEKPTQQTTFEQPENIEGILAAIQTKLTIRQ